MSLDRRPSIVLTNRQKNTLLLSVHRATLIIRTLTPWIVLETAYTALKNSDFHSKISRHNFLNSSTVQGKIKLPDAGRSTWTSISFALVDGFSIHSGWIFCGCLSQHHWTALNPSFKLSNLNHRSMWSNRRPRIVKTERNFIDLGPPSHSNHWD